MDFKNLKSGELERRVLYYEEILRTLDLTSLDEKAIDRMRTELEKITDELAHLGQFTRMNYTGFLKILKKHDKHTKFLLKPTYMVKFIIKPIQVKRIDELVYRLSKLYSMLSGHLTLALHLNNGESSQVFVRKTAKYWVHPDNVMDVKLTIMKHLPVLIYSSPIGGEYDIADAAISSVYLDNDQMELYTGRLDKTEGAEAVRLRWYGSKQPKEVFVERKIHREDWTGEVSVKSRFLLKEKHVANYIRGSFNTDQLVTKLKESGLKTEKELQELKTLGDEIQASVQNKHLRPMLRTFYNRTAFQLPGDAAVRISLDTELCMIKEDGFVPQNNWKRPDVLCEFPFANLSAINNEIVRFPYAVLEVKLQTLQGNDPPPWVTRLVEGPLVKTSIL